MKHICHITIVHPRYDIRIFHKECKSLSLEYKVSLIVADELADEVIDGVAIYSVGKPRSRQHRFLGFAKIVLAKLQQLQPQLVHLHDPELLMLVPRLRQMGFKIVYDAHEDLPKQILSKHWIPSLVRPLLSKLAGMVERNSIRKLDCVIAATPQIESNFANCKLHTTIYNYPILDSSSYTNMTAWSDKDDAIAYVGSISTTRGITTLVDSLAISKCELKLAGKFSENSLQEKLQTSVGWQYVSYYGVLAHSKVDTEVLQKSKVGIVTVYPTPSYVESLPIKLFEYMLSGIPVIASNFPMWSDIVEKYQCGILVDPQDAEAIAQATTYLLDNQEIALQMGQNGHRAVLEHFSWKVEARKLINIYHKMI